MNGNNNTPQIFFSGNINHQLETSNLTILHEKSNNLNHNPNISSTQILPHILDSLWRNKVEILILYANHYKLSRTNLQKRSELFWKYDVFQNTIQTDENKIEIDY